MITVSCKLWNNENKTWNEDVCDVGHLTANGMVHCSCRPVVDNNSYKLTISNVFEEVCFCVHVLWLKSIADWVLKLIQSSLVHNMQ